MDFTEYHPPKKPTWQIVLAWVIYVSILAFIFIGSTMLLSRDAHAAENYLGTGMDKEEFMHHMDPFFEDVVDAIYRAEGGAKAKKPFGILSVPCSDFTDCQRICKNTVRNNYVRWIKAGRPGEFIDFLGSRYAPVGVHPLNRHWVKNVNAIMYPDLTR